MVPTAATATHIRGKHVEGSVPVNTTTYPAVAAGRAPLPVVPMPSRSETVEFLDWLRRCRRLEISEAAATRVTQLTLEDFVAEHGRPRGQGLSLAGPTTAMWWPGLYVQDFGDYRLFYTVEYSPDAG